MLALGIRILIRVVLEGVLACEIGYKRHDAERRFRKSQASRALLETTGAGIAVYIDLEIGDVPGSALMHERPKFGVGEGA